MIAIISCNLLRYNSGMVNHLDNSIQIDLILLTTAKCLLMVDGLAEPGIVTAVSHKVN